jgi:thiol-disulfide isomerase/thioredoxin
MQRSWLSLALTISILCFWEHSTTEAQSVDSPPKKAYAQEIQVNQSIAKFSVSLSKADATVGEEVSLEIQAKIAKGWHIGSTSSAPDAIGFPTQIQFDHVGLEPIDKGFTSNIQPQELNLAIGKQQYMQGEFTWSRKYRVTALDSKYGGTGTVRFQACDNTKCLAPQTVKFELGETQGGNTFAHRDGSMSSSDSEAVQAAEETVGDPMVLKLEPSDLKRTRPQLNVSNIVALLLVGKSTDRMVWKATIPSGPNEGVSIYLPRTSKYSLVNTGSDGTIVGNTATYVSVDQDGDEKLAEWEAAAVNRPIRIRDTMYLVKEINSENKTMTIQELDIPLKGSLVGFRCPDFELKALDGSVVSNKSILGKITILDIWAVTCHNCYEGFPKIRNSVEKHGHDKVNVILLTVDTDRQFYDSLAPRLFQTYGGGDWPQIMLPGGFDGALTFGDYGFGSVVVDEKGIVRAVGALGFNIEALIDQVVQTNRP